VRSAVVTLRRLLELARVPRGEAVLATALAALAVVFGVGLLSAAGYLISRAAEQPPILALTTTIVVVRFFGLARPLARYLERLASHDLGLRALATIRARYYERIEPLAPAQLEGYRRGDLLARMVRDVDELQGAYVRGVAPLVVALAVGAVCVGVTAAVLPLAAAVLAAGLALGAVAVPAVAVWASRSTGRRAALRGALTAELVEVLRGAPELVAYGREQETLDAVRHADSELTRLARRDALAGGLTDALVVAVAGLTVVGVLAVAVSAHDAGSLDRVLVATLALLALSSFEAVAALPAAARELASTLASGRRVLELVERQPAVRDPAVPAELDSRSGLEVALESVTARYAAGEPAVLQSFDLRLSPGRRVALVGPSGSGKTTVTNLLLRFLDPEAGRVTIGGTDIRDCRQEDVRRTFALAGQESHLFDSTIRENLRLARPDASDHDLELALARARIGDWVATLPDRLDTLVGEDGLHLSGGQRQRLVLARALLADAPVLILDEPTAHLDPPTAERFVADVLDEASDRSVLLITHRPEGLDRVDEIVALT
jgi:ATP-binding cassette, subfamily C, bacterial CydC